MDLDGPFSRVFPGGFHALFWIKAKVHTFLLLEANAEKFGKKKRTMSENPTRPKGRRNDMGTENPTRCGIDTRQKVQLTLEQIEVLETYAKEYGITRAAALRKVIKAGFKYLNLEGTLSTKEKRIRVLESSVLDIQNRLNHIEGTLDCTGNTASLVLEEDDEWNW